MSGAAVTAWHHQSYTWPGFECTWAILDGDHSALRTPKRRQRLNSLRVHIIAPYSLRAGLAESQHETLLGIPR